MSPPMSLRPLQTAHGGKDDPSLVQYTHVYMYIGALAGSSARAGVNGCLFVRYAVAQALGLDPHGELNNPSLFELRENRIRSDGVTCGLWTRLTRRLEREPEKRLARLFAPRL